MNWRGFLLLISALVSGCGQSEIELVKGGRFTHYPDFTIGQAFDNRKVCKSTDWTTFVDERERTIVEYRCVLRDVGVVYSERAQRKLLQAQNDREDFLTRNADYIKRSEEGISKQYKYLEIMKAKGASPDSIARIERSIAHSEGLLEEGRQRRITSGEDHEQKIQEAKVYIDLVASDEAEAYEYYQWSIGADDEFYTIAGGVLLRKPGGAEFEPLTEYSDFTAPLEVLYADKFSDYSNYTKAVSQTGWLRALGH